MWISHVRRIIRKKGLLDAKEGGGTANYTQTSEIEGSSQIIVAKRENLDRIYARVSDCEHSNTLQNDSAPWWTNPSRVKRSDQSVSVQPLS